MSLPDRLERAGIVVGSAFLLSLPIGTLLLVVVPDLLDWPALYGLTALLLPGVVVGVLVAAGRLPATYREVWLFSLLAWLVTFGLWQALAGSAPPDDRSLAVALWVVALAIAGLVTWRREWVLERLASEPEES